MQPPLDLPPDSSKDTSSHNVTSGGPEQVVVLRRGSWAEAAAWACQVQHYCNAALLCRYKNKPGCRMAKTLLTDRSCWEWPEEETCKCFYREGQEASPPWTRRMEISLLCARRLNMWQDAGRLRMRPAEVVASGSRWVRVRPPSPSTAPSFSFQFGARRSGERKRLAHR